MKKALFAALLAVSFLISNGLEADAACQQISVSNILNGQTCPSTLTNTGCSNSNTLASCQNKINTALCGQNSSALCNQNISASCNQNTLASCNQNTSTLNAGNCNSNVKATVEIPTYSAQKKKPSFKSKRVTIQKGSKKKLKVKNATSCKKWKSKNKKIAKVSKKGVVTGLKKGTTKITCKADGVKISCKVTVKGKSKGKSGGNSNGNSNSNSNNNSNGNSNGNTNGNSNSGSNGNSQVSTSTSHVEDMLKLINAERAKQGLNALTTTTALTSAANARAKEIYTSFAHTRPDGSSCFTILPEFGITAGYKGENIAYGQPTVASVMNAWMNSDGHRKNILSANFKKVGIGRYKVGSTYYWVQIFTD